MLETIMVPLDGSSAAEIVFPFIEEISSKFSSRIIFVAVAYSGSTDLPHLYRSYLERVKEQIQSQLDDHGAKEATKISIKVLSGDPTDEILHYADMTDTSLIAMASHGSSGHGHQLLGSTVAKVLWTSRRPMLLIRAPANKTVVHQKTLFERILVPLDGSRVGEAAIPFAEGLARVLGSELVLFHVMESLATVASDEYSIPQKFFDGRRDSAMAYLERMKQQLIQKGLRVTSEIGDGPPADLIIDYAKSKAIQVIAMSTHGRSGAGRWVFGSVTAKVLHSGDAAVLVFPPVKT
jgi:nucleotide-binding universal stress UspA family protein